jgi:hypothetical protein
MLVSSQLIVIDRIAAGGPFLNANLSATANMIISLPGHDSEYAALLNI